MRTSKGQSTRKEKSYENIYCSNLQSWARDWRVRRATRRKQTEEKAGANGAARTAAGRACDGCWSRPQENVNGSLSGQEGSRLNGNLSRAEGQQGANLSGRLSRSEEQEGPDLSRSLWGAQGEERPNVSGSL